MKVFIAILFIIGFISAISADSISFCYKCEGVKSVACGAQGLTEQCFVVSDSGCVEVSDQCSGDATGQILKMDFPNNGQTATGKVYTTMTDCKSGNKNYTPFEQQCGTCSNSVTIKCAGSGSGSGTTGSGSGTTGDASSIITNFGLIAFFGAVAVLA